MPSPLPRVLDVPLLPLSGVVLFPGSVLPLRVFEPRYVRLLNDVMVADKLIGMAHAKPNADLSGNCAPVHDVLGVGVVIAKNDMADGTFHIALLGHGRYRIDAEIPHQPYRRARVLSLPDSLTALPNEIAALRTEFAGLLRTANALVARTVDNEVSSQVKKILACAGDAGAVTDLLAGIYVHDSALKQSLLDCTDVLARTRILNVILEKLLQRLDPKPAPQDYSHRTICLN